MTQYLDFPTGRFWLGDTFDAMAQMPEASVDMVLADLPYGTTACKWDSALPFDQLWAAYDRIAKPNAAIVLTASQPFTSALVMSNPEWFRHEWVWDKVTISNPMQARYQPLRQHETVLVFSKKSPVLYFPQKTDLKLERRWVQGKQNKDAAIPATAGKTGVVRGKYPKTIQSFKSAKFEKPVHPTQKPVALFEYLIRTYTNPGDLVLDNTAGSGTTAIAAINTERRWWCVERDPDYYAKAVSRVMACQ